jgi:hypothetical protein
VRINFLTNVSSYSQKFKKLCFLRLSLLCKLKALNGSLQDGAMKIL